MGTGAFKLTQRTVEAAKCPPGRKDRLLFDSELLGFGLRVTAAGSRTFLAQYLDPRRQASCGARCLRRSHCRGSAKKGQVGAWHRSGRA